MKGVFVCVVYLNSISIISFLTQNALHEVQHFRIKELGFSSTPTGDTSLKSLRALGEEFRYLTPSAYLNSPFSWKK